MRQNKMPASSRTDARRYTGPEYLARGATPLALAVVAVLGQAAQAATIDVTTTNQEINDDAFCSLQEAIYAANRDDNQAPDPANPGTLLTTGCASGSGTDAIYLGAGSVLAVAGPVNDYSNYLGPTATPMVTSTIAIEGQGARFVRLVNAPYTRAFAVGAGGDLTIHELHIDGFAVRGGDGNDGGGGGMGAGGAIYVHSGSLGIGWSTFEGNSAEGGNGGDRREGPVDGWHTGGGGGGLGGNGGVAGGDDKLGGGGGGGARGNGGDGNIVSCNPPPGELCAFGFGGGGGGTVGHGRAGTAGTALGGRECGGNGGGTQMGDDGSSATCDGGGGGGGNSASVDTIALVKVYEGGDGGSGRYGGGGGGGGWGSTFTLGLGTNGGQGGFGAGGGSSGGTSGGSGGNGGFGGGGGAGIEKDVWGGIGQGGTFGGDGGGNYGGGGAGLGGAVFGHESTIYIQNSTFYGNRVRRGLSGGGNANDGRGAGGAIFAVGGDLRIENSTIAGNASDEYNLDPDTGEKVGLGGGGIVVYDPIGDVEATFRLRNSIVAGNDNSECYTRNGVDTDGSEGNLILDSTVNTRGDPPCPGVARTDDPLLGNLALNGPGRTPTMKPGAGSPAIDAAVGNYTADDQRGILRPQGSNGDIGAYEASSLPPTTTITLDPASPNGANGWYVSAVGVTVSATDPDSANVETRCVFDPASVPTVFADLPSAPCAVSSVSTDGPQHVIYAASLDDDGNTDAAIVSASLKLDATDPTLNPALSVSGPVIVGQAGVTATANATDATSEVASSGCDSVGTSSPGVNTVSCTATDNAGNEGSATLTYVVEYRILGFFSPVPFSKWKEGQRVPVKVALGDAAGARIPSAESATLAQECRVSFEASGTQSQGPDCMKYDAAKDQFVYNWKLDKGDIGTATIFVEVSYPGTNVTTQLSAPITITH